MRSIHHVFESDDEKTAIAELEADSTFRKLTPREQNFISNFLISVSGNRTIDGMNFQSDLRSYGYKNVDKLYSVYTKHYPRFAKLASASEERVKGEGISAQIGKLETYLESILKEINWKPVVHASEVRDGIKADLEDWSGHDPSVGIYGGKEGSVTLVLLDEDLGMRWEWEDHVNIEKQNEVEALFTKNKSAIHELVKEIQTG